MTTPTSTSLEAEKLLPCDMPKACDFYRRHGSDAHHEDCVANRRPAVASALQSKDERIAELETELGRYREAVTLPELVNDGEEYMSPEHGWTCYHCGVHFANSHRGWQAAGHHFGWTPDRQPACRIAEEEGGLPRRLRSYEDGQKRDEKTIAALEAEVARLRAAQTKFEPFAQLVFLWAKEPAREGELDRYREAYHAWLEALSPATPLTVEQKEGTP